MPTQTIESQDINVGTLFQAFYAVPDYQRAYVWGDSQVEQLLTDIRDEMPSGPKAGSLAEYFIGSIVVCPGRFPEVLDLIDGQQRMTTLFVVLCAVRDRLAALSDTAETPIKGQLSSQSMADDGRSIHRYRLDLQYEDAKDILVRLAKGEVTTDADVTTASAENILNAHRTALQFLTREFRDDPDRVRAFYAYLVNRVKLIRIQTEGVAKALKIFETVNDRGVGLDSMDLLKNLLFVQAGQDEFSKLKVVWDELQTELHSAGEKPLRFLRYFAFSKYSPEALREDDLYDWFKKNEKEIKYKHNPIGFAKDLVSSAKAYTRFLAGQDEAGRAHPALQSMRILGGSAARQHLILLLAGRHLPPDLFDQLAREVENLFFAYVVTRELTRDFERNFSAWAGELRDIKTSAELSDFIEKRFRPAKAALTSRFVDVFERLMVSDLQAYRLRYVLAKLTQAVELNAYGLTEGTRWLQRYFDSKSYEIEHILPVTADQSCLAEFGDDTGVWTQRLGNLALVEQGINSSLGRKPFSQKRPVYLQSQLLLTRAIAEKPTVGINTRINAAVAGLDCFTSWNPKAVTQRQGQLAALAKHVWEMPPSTQQAPPAS